MKNYFLLIFLILFSSCKKTNTLDQNDSIADTYYKKAKKAGQDSAFYYFNLAKNSYLEKPDSVGVGRSLVNMAIIQYNNGDYYGSIETSLEANKFLKNPQDSIAKLTLAASYNNMGICSSYLYDFDNSVKFYKEALKYVNIPENKYTYYNNLGNVLTTVEKYPEAKKNLKQALNTKNKISYARALNNLARAKFNENPNYDALPELYQALKIRQEEKNPYEENSSYATLSNYFLKKDSNKALDYAKKMLEVSMKNDSKEDQIQALQKIINLDKKNYFKYFVRFQTLNDSVQIARSKAKNQFAVVRYDVEVKNAENQLLKNKNFKQTIGLTSLGLIIIGGIFWYRKRKKRLQQEKELEVKNTQLKMSKKVHDVVANGIYQVMTKIENQEDFDKDKALDELEFVYEKSRDISYEKIDAMHEEKDFDEKISELIGSFKNDFVNTYIAGNEKEIWENVSNTTQDEVYQVIRELLVNMKKHSEAERVAFRFERENNLIKIYYTDNGIGISGDIIYKNGLSSTVSRIETIQGEIIFDTKTEKGLKITISFPAS
jgi:tetratricopeptide (TPR) repeat protein